MRIGTLAAFAVVGLLVASIAACAGPAPSPSAGGTASPAGSAPSTAPASSTAADPSPAVSPEPDLTPVPGATAGPSDQPQGGGTTVIDWGTILDRVPEDFPIFPGASPVDAPDGPASGAWFADDAGVDDLAAWYRDRLEGLGFTTKDLSSPLEDGSRVLDTVSDLPECRIQTTFRPAGGSTMIIVLYGAGCAGGEG